MLGGVLRGSPDRNYAELVKAFAGGKGNFKTYIDWMNRLQTWNYVFPGCRTVRVDRYVETPNMILGLARTLARTRAKDTKSMENSKESG